MIRLKRGYEDTSPGTGILLELLWPRGVSKDDAQIDAWVEDVAPSTELRKWYVVNRWPEFCHRYQEELAAPERQEALKDLASKARHGTVTFIYAAKDTEHNGAVVLQDYLERQFAP